MHMEPFTDDAYIEDEEFKEAFQQIQVQICIKEGDDKADYPLQNGLLYKLDKLCVPKFELLLLIREVHTSKVTGNFGVGKTVDNLQNYVYYPRCKKNS